MSQNKYNPRYDLYNTYKMREFSFNNYWATVDSKRRLVMEMADAGFFYCGNSVNDKAACFSCGGVIEDWEIYDDPWLQHAQNFPDCFYLNAVKDAIKIDISPEVFSAVLQTPQKTLSQVFVTARAFQPAVVFMRNVERVFTKKVPEEQKFLKATTLKGSLRKVVKSVPDEDKVIFIATCTDPWVASVKPMLSVFDEILLVPRTDYGSLQQFFYKKFQSIRSMPRDYPVQPLAHVTQGFGFADIIEVYNEVMTPERIVRLNIKPLSPGEFIDALMQKGLEPLTLDDYQKYVDFYINNSELKKEREDYARINFVRADVYEKAEKKKTKAERAKTSSTND